MTLRERAEKLAGPRPCNYGGPGDDAAERKWRDRVNAIGRELANVRHETVCACTDAVEGYFPHGLRAIVLRLSALAGLYTWCDEDD